MQIQWQQAMAATYCNHLMQSQCLCVRVKTNLTSNNNKHQFFALTNLPASKIVGNHAYDPAFALDVGIDVRISVHNIVGVHSFGHTCIISNYQSQLFEESSFERTSSSS